MEFFKAKTNIDFMGKRKWTGSFSLLLCICSLFLIFKLGLNFGLEFTGGMQVELRFANPVETQDIKQQLQQAGFHDVRIQLYGSPKDILLRITNSALEDEQKIKAKIIDVFKKTNKEQVEIRKIEYIGSEVGHQLAEQGGIAVLMAILATMVYIALRFEYRFAVSAAIGLVHDAIIILGVFSLLQIEFDLATLASILAVIGYSLNDTIVIFDRVRENFRKMRKGTTIQIINASINQTLSRTIMTSWLTLLVVLALLFFGGESLFGFSLALCIGIIVGTYSSIFVAGVVALKMGLSRADLLPKPKVELDSMP